MIKDILAEYVAANRREFEDRTDTVGSSEIGLCARRVCYEKHQGEVMAGVPVPIRIEDGWGAAARGTVMENSFWYPALRARFGDDLLYAGPDQRTLKKGKLSSTPDGLLVRQPAGLLRHLGVKTIGRDRSVLVECKTIDPRVNLREAKRENVFQVQVQMGLVRDLTHHRPEYALVSYVDASFWDDVEEYAIRFDPGVYESAHARARTILGTDDARDLKPEGWIAGGRECEYCPYNQPCGIERRRVPTGPDRGDPDPQFVAEITDLAAEAKRYKDQSAELDEKYRGLQVQIKDRLRDRGVRRIADVVTWTEVRGRTTFDAPKLQEALEKAGLRIEDYQKSGDPSDRLQILL